MCQRSAIWKVRPRVPGTLSARTDTSQRDFIPILPSQLWRVASVPCTLANSDRGLAKARACRPGTQATQALASAL